MAEFRRVLRLRHLVAASAGLALASVSFPAAAAALGAVGGWGVAVAILGAGGLGVLVALCFGELCSMFPYSGGMRVYVGKAFGDRAALTLTFLYLFLAVASAGAESYVFASVLSAFSGGVPPQVWATIFLLATLAVNLRGIEIAGRAQEVLSFLMFGLILAIAIGALLLWPSRAAAGQALPFPAFGNLSGLGLAAALAVFLFVGFEWITPLAEEAEDVEKGIPRAMPIAILLLTGSYAIFTLAMSLYVPAEQLAAPGNVVPHLQFAPALGGPALLAVMGVVSVLATVTSFNAGIMGTSRMAYALAREGVLPKSLSKVHPQYATPWSALVFLLGVTLVLTLLVAVSGAWQLPVLVAASIEAIVYSVVAGAVLRLRRTQPDAPRPFRVPGGRALPAVACGAFAVLAFLAFADETYGLAAALVVGVGIATSFTYVRLVVEPRRARAKARVAPPPPPRPA